MKLFLYSVLVASQGALAFDRIAWFQKNGEEKPLDEIRSSIEFDFYHQYLEEASMSMDDNDETPFDFPSSAPSKVLLKVSTDPPTAVSSDAPSNSTSEQPSSAPSDGTNPSPAPSNPPSPTPTKSNNDDEIDITSGTMYVHPPDDVPLLATFVANATSGDGIAYFGTRAADGSVASVTSIRVFIGGPEGGGIRFLLDPDAGETIGLMDDDGNLVKVEGSRRKRRSMRQAPEQSRNLASEYHPVHYTISSEWCGDTVEEVHVEEFYLTNTVPVQEIWDIISAGGSFPGVGGFVGPEEFTEIDKHLFEAETKVEVHGIPSLPDDFASLTCNGIKSIVNDVASGEAVQSACARLSYPPVSPGLCSTVIFFLGKNPASNIGECERIAKQIAYSLVGTNREIVARASVCFEGDCVKYEKEHRYYWGTGTVPVEWESEIKDILRDDDPRFGEWEWKFQSREAVGDEHVCSGSENEPDDSILNDLIEMDSCRMKISGDSLGFPKELIVAPVDENKATWEVKDEETIDSPPVSLTSTSHVIAKIVSPTEIQLTAFSNVVLELPGFSGSCDITDTIIGERSA